MLGWWPDGWRKASYSDEMVPEQIRKSAVPGQTFRNPQTGHTLQKQANGRWKLVDSGPKVEGDQTTSSQVPDVSKMKKLAEGNYGVVYQDPQTGHVVKTLKEGKEWGPHEVELGKKMGELGHSPKIYSASNDHIEMDFSKGKPLWTGGFNRTEDEKERDVKMTTQQAQKALAAIKDLHKMGFYHGDMHNEQFLTDGEGGKESTLIDFGLSGKIQDQPHKALVDFNKVGKLIDIYRPEFDEDPYVNLVRDSVEQYKAAKGQSKAAVAKRAQIGLEYFDKLSQMD
ncbi:MAG: Cyanophage [Pseudomonadota bacterium]|jgi:tRNA A-37 threonylcarbamoyl transferase component Bud32